jgi:hypothetical protein
MAYNKRDMNERLAFVRFWANYIKTNSNKVWSQQQSKLINSILKSANQNPELYLTVKKRISSGKFVSK